MLSQCDVMASQTPPWRAESSRNPAIPELAKPTITKAVLRLRDAVKETGTGENEMSELVQAPEHKMEARSLGVQHKIVLQG